MSNLIKAFFVLATLLLATQASAQGKIAVVDIQRAILETDAAKVRLESLRQDASYIENKNQFDSIQKEGVAVQEKLQKDSAVMSEEQKTAQITKLKELQSDLKHVASKLQAAEQQLAREILIENEARARTVITDIIKQETIGLLLDGQAALHADTSFDITAKVTQRLNAPPSAGK